MIGWRKTRLSISVSHEQEVHKEFLTKEELETMQNKVFKFPNPI